MTPMESDRAGEEKSFEGEAWSSEVDEQSDLEACAFEVVEDLRSMIGREGRARRKARRPRRSSLLFRS